MELSGRRVLLPPFLTYSSIFGAAAISGFVLTYPPFTYLCRSLYYPHSYVHEERVLSSTPYAA